MSTIAKHTVESTSPQHDTTTFHQYQRLPDELKVMIWRCFAEAEMARRMVIVYVSPGDEEDEDNAEHSVLDLKILPLKRLISPLLKVNYMTREVALRHYATRIDIYERESPYPGISHPMWEKTFEDLEGTPRQPARYGFPDVAAWDDRGGWCQDLEEDVAHVADDHLASDIDDMQRQPQHRGCVYLNLSTDRFYPFEQWYQKNYYGLRAVTEALTDFKYNAIPFDLESILDHRPPALRNASSPLSTEVRAGIRQVVFPCYAPAPAADAEDWRLYEDPIPETTPGTLVHAMDVFDSQSWMKTLPGAFEDLGSSDEDDDDASDDNEPSDNGSSDHGSSDDSTADDDSSPDSGSSSNISSTTVSTSTTGLPHDGITWGFLATDEMYRTFFDDIEEKGPEHLLLQRARQRKTGSEGNEWDLVWA
ncbi:hypothetical protein PG991_003456 [Apiospora marii]|uniref:2EXR domain-containing protein n=1 Tax=Apiospora marii TaxID=335849 RepID=A0ABR1S4S6_9PEZI